jgi:adenylate cyclase class 2
MKDIEVEQKFRLPRPAQLREKIIEAGAKAVGSGRQIDVYYNAPHRDFLAEGRTISEWLRLREEDGRYTITYKHWYGLEKGIKAHCDELESTLGNGEAVKKLLAAMDFTELVTVDKRREEWQFGDVLVAFDDVKDLGSFAEFEYRGQATSVAQAHDHLDEQIAGLGVELEACLKGYPHQLIDKLLDGKTVK